ncbi:ComF family protein [Parasphingorhabdus halotolerans]|uniref:ComF family protein n=1 Tax=Parasphingorhabdus halotolerans TaxID=2725558 RepID=UPI001FE98F37|nr:ComF family protein [Parasphingorhabdus halotolerans]
MVAYDDHSAQLVTRLKYGGRLGLARLIAEHLVKFSLAVPRDSVIVPVPLHRWRLWSRGFNQSVLIGRTLAEFTGLSLELDAICRKNATPPLYSKSAKQRQKIVKDAFTMPGSSRALIAGKTIVLVDDVYTTGSTSNACAKVLKQGGADKVLVFCWARVLAGEDTI